MPRVRVYLKYQSSVLSVTVWALAFFASPSSLLAQSYTVLTDFGEQAEGSSPKAGLLNASDGNYYGTTTSGGYGWGTIFKITAAGVLTTLHRFNVSDGSNPEATLIQASDGLLYGTTTGGGTNGAGTIYSFNIADGTFAYRHSFGGGTNAHYPAGGLTQGSDGNFYGTTQGGGDFGLGTIYRWSPSDTPALTLLSSFSPYDPALGVYPDGYQPSAGVVEGETGVLYGTVTFGGASGGGTLFKYVIGTGTLTKLHDFTSGGGTYPYARLTKGADAALYGVTANGGATGAGTIFRWNPAAPAGTEFTTLHSFNGTSGRNPYAPLLRGADGNFYGATVQGGAQSRGTIFRFAPGAAVPFTMLYSLTSADGANPYGVLAEGPSGTLFGTANASGTGGSAGTVFKLTTGATTAMVTLHGFEGSPARPESPLVQAADGTLYGTTAAGGPRDAGVIFKVDPAGIATTIHKFNRVDGYAPSGDLILDSTTGQLFGTTQSGGVGCGNIYRLNLSTQALTTEHTFDCSGDGDGPQEGLIKGSDGLFYGTTAYGGVGYGTVFKWNPDPSATPRLTVLKIFHYDTSTSPYLTPDGYYPAGLVEGAPGTFYGVATAGGATARSAGTVFRITSSGVFTKLYEFLYDAASGTHPSGANPYGGLVKASDGHFYGTTNQGGASSHGTLFRMTAAGVFSVVHEFNGTEGSKPYGRLQPDADGNLYGSTENGGANSTGTLFRFDPAAQAFTHLYALAPYDEASRYYPEGYNPQQALLAGADGLWYGTTYGGGRAYKGVVFRLDPPPAVRVLRADGGEKLFTGNPYLIQWTAADNQPLASFDVYFSADGGTTFGSSPICAAVAGSARSCTWSTPVETTQGRFRVVAHDSAGGAMSDDSDADFTVVAGSATITVTSPNTALTWSVGTVQTITWTHNLGSASTVSVSISRDAGATFTPIAIDIANTGSLPWTVASPSTTQARIQVTSTNGPTAADQSDVNFTITTDSGPTCCVTVTQPTKKAIEYGIGSTQQIKWTHNLGAGSSVKIELSRDGGLSYPEVIAASVPNTSATAGLYNWLVAGPSTTAARVRVTSTTGTASDSSDLDFKIALPYIRLANPGASWGYGTLQKVAWTTNLGLLDKITVQLSQNSGATFVTVAANAAASKKRVNVTTPTLASPITTARLKVIWNNPPSGFSAEDATADFRIEPPFVTVSAPNGGELWTVGSKHPILWNSNLGKVEKVSVMLSKDGGATFGTTLLSGTPSDGTQALIMQSGWSTTTGRIRIAWLKNAAISDESNGNFSIQ